MILLILILIITVAIIINYKNMKNIKNNINIDKYIDMIYYINLDTREDRKHHIINELSKTNISKDKITRISATYDIKGAIGCSKSHINILKKFIESNYNNCLILEDDFKFVQDTQTINQILENFFTNNIDYDLLMLSSNTIKDTTTKYKFINKVIDAQTTSGYIVSKKFAPVLLKHNIDGLKLLEETKNDSLYCIDRYWKKLQPISNWYVCNPKIGNQIESYSDIEKKQVNYQA